MVPGNLFQCEQIIYPRGFRHCSERAVTLFTVEIVEIRPTESGTGTGDAYNMRSKGSMQRIKQFITKR